MIAFWLMPSAGEREIIRSLVVDLARRCDATAFEPHVTLQAGNFEEATALRCLNEISFSALDLAVQSISFSDAFTKTVFVQFAPSAEAAELSAQIGNALGAAGAYQFDPHLSLIYKTMSASQKRSIADEVAWPFTRVRFDTVRLIAGPAHTRTWQDVESWRTLGERRLSETGT